jgi:hypothetical protein
VDKDISGGYPAEIKATDSIDNARRYDMNFMFKSMVAIRVFSVFSALSQYHGIVFET